MAEYNYSQKKGIRARIPKVVKKTAISAFVLLMLMIVAGVIYVFFSDKKVNDTAIQKNETPKQTLPDAFKPKPPNPNAPVGVALASLTSPVKAGTNASISVRTNALAKCKISVTYNGKVSTDSGLAPQAANEYGVAMWTWTVESTVPAGKWPVKVTCANSKKSGVVIGDLKVIK